MAIATIAFLIFKTKTKAAPGWVPGEIYDAWFGDWSVRVQKGYMNPVAESMRSIGITVTSSSSLEDDWLHFTGNESDANKVRQIPGVLDVQMATPMEPNFPEYGGGSPPEGWGYQ